MPSRTSASARRRARRCRIRSRGFPAQLSAGLGQGVDPLPLPARFSGCRSSGQALNRMRSSSERTSGTTCGMRRNRPTDSLCNVSLHPRLAGIRRIRATVDASRKISQCARVRNDSAIQRAETPLWGKTTATANGPRQQPDRLDPAGFAGATRASKRAAAGRLGRLDRKGGRLGHPLSPQDSGPLIRARRPASLGARA
jgi:hypothetical protein